MGRRFLYNTALGTLTDIRLSGLPVTITYDNKLGPEGSAHPQNVRVGRDFITTDYLASTENNQSQLVDLGRRLEYCLGRIPLDGRELAQGPEGGGQRQPGLPLRRDGTAGAAGSEHDDPGLFPLVGGSPVCSGPGFLDSPAA